MRVLRFLFLDPLTKPFRAFAWALLVLLVGCFLVSDTPYGLWQPYSSSVPLKTAFFFGQDRSCDVLLLGASRIKGAISAGYAETLLHDEYGLDTSVFNLGMGGSTARNDYVFFRTLVRDRPAPEVVVFSANAPRFNSHNFRMKHFLTSYAQLPEIWHSLLAGQEPATCLAAIARRPCNYLQYLMRPPDSRAVRRKIQRIMAVRGSTYDPVADGGFLSSEEELARAPERIRAMTGIREEIGPELDTLDNRALYERFQQVLLGHVPKRWEDFEIGPVMREETEAFLDLAEEKGVHVIFLELPRTARSQELESPEGLAIWREFMADLATRHDFDFVPYTPGDPPLEGHFKDIDHVSSQGCKIYTEWFVRKELAPVLTKLPPRGDGR